MAKLDAFFKLMNEQGASDLHLAAGQPPLIGSFLIVLGQNSGVEGSRWRINSGLHSVSRNGTISSTRA